MCYDYRTIFIQKKIWGWLHFELYGCYSNGMSTYSIGTAGVQATAVNSFFDWKAAIGVRYVF